ATLSRIDEASPISTSGPFPAHPGDPGAESGGAPPADGKFSRWGGPALWQSSGPRGLPSERRDGQRRRRT
ncbi:hypothetical protein, partial [Mycolicibacterium fortuitum]|uniref:hypothetical protein n=1 Tax=Mycolicibacterium fortuitum TaxID=1766 RepID=UPI001C2657CB